MLIVCYRLDSVGFKPQGFRFQVSLNPPPYPFVLRFAIESPPDFLHPLKRAGELRSIHIAGKGKPCGFFGGRAGATSLRHSGHISLFKKAWRLFRGDVREQRPSGTADTYLYSGKPGGFLWGTCRSNVPPSYYFYSLQKLTKQMIFMLFYVILF